MKNYKKIQRCEKIIQFGEGGFLRGFVDWILQEMNEKTDFDASCVVVQPIRDGLCDRLSEQNCVYTHIMRGMENGEAVSKSKIIDSISRCIKPYDEFDKYLELAKIKDLRFVFSNTTESGIVYDENDDLYANPPKSFPAKLTRLLFERFKLGLAGFIFMPCELIDKNGETLKEIILKIADKNNLGEDFKLWIKNENTFCNTLVDRIVTGYPKDEKIDLPYTDNMLNTSELFHLWVIEGPNDILKEIPFDNLEKYRTRKVRILNGAHTSMIPYAMLEGIETVKDCMENEKMSEFVKKCVFDEIIPTLDLTKEELVSYANDVFERFNNPFIKH